MDDIATLKNNQFELLSAYLDHEVSIDERKQVEQWLKEDADFYRLHQQMLMLQRSCQVLPGPEADSHAIEQTIEGVFTRLDSRRRFPVWGTVAAAAVAATIGAIAGAWNGGGPLSPQFANNSDGEGSIIASFEPSPSAVEVPSLESADSLASVEATSVEPLASVESVEPVASAEPVDPSNLMIALEHPPVELPPALEVSNTNAIQVTPDSISD